jgi:hypothetical protein
MPEHLLLEPPVAAERPSAVHAIAASPWAPLLAVTGQRQILLYHTDAGTRRHPAVPEGDPVSLAFTPDARYLIVGGGIPGKSGTTVTFDVTNGSACSAPAGNSIPCSPQTSGPDFDIVATGGPSKLLKIWNTERPASRPLDQETHRLDHRARHFRPTASCSPAATATAASGSGNRRPAPNSTPCAPTRPRSPASLPRRFQHPGQRLRGRLRALLGNERRRRGEKNRRPPRRSHRLRLPGRLLRHRRRDNKAKLWKADFNMLREFPLPALPTAAAFDGEGKRAFVADAAGNIHAFPVEGDAAPTAFPTNPPSIQTRLQTIANRIKESKAENEIAGLKAQEKHWTAAAINTRVLHTVVETQALAGRAEEDIVGFSASLAEVDAAVAALNGKREQRDAFAGILESKDLPEAHRQEAMATLLSLDASIKNLRDSLREKENAIAETRRSADNTLSSLSKLKSEEQGLRDSYQQALK